MVSGSTSPTTFSVDIDIELAEDPERAHRLAVLLFSPREDPPIGAAGGKSTQ